MSSELEQDPEYALSKADGFMQHAKDVDWFEKNVPCQVACPANTYIPGYLEAVAKGEYEAAYRINLRDNIFPAVLGRVCTRPCEPACRHGWEGLGEPVAICWSKRVADDFMADQAPTVLDPVFASSSKRIAIVGAGPSGLATARELQLWGHQVTIFEKHHKPGGMMQQGIPEFRLPRNVVDREIAQIEAQGVDIRCGVSVGSDISLATLQSDYDAVILAAGTFKPNRPEIDGVELAGVRHGVSFLQEINEKKTAPIGKKVVVIGGGFTAVDCVRIARRLGCEDVTMVYRRQAAHSYIPAEEFDALEREGIKLEFLAAPQAFQPASKSTGAGDAVGTVSFIRTDVAEDGSLGQIEGSEFVLEADTVLLGTGQAPNRDWLDSDIDALPESTFLTGDFITGPTSLIDSIGHAKICARRVDEFLMGEDRFESGYLVEDIQGGSTGRTRGMDEIERQDLPMLPMAERGVTDEVELGLPEAPGKTEASRCYLCNFKFEIDNDLCIYCDRCLLVMPVENCIVKVSELIFDEQDRIAGVQRSLNNADYNHLYLDQNECIRCGACVEVCPVDCITLQKVTHTCRAKCK